MTVPSCADGTVPGFLGSIAASFATDDAVVDERGRLTYADLEARSRALAKELLGLGVAKYARVGLVAPNSADWVVSWFAVARIGAVAVPVSTFATAPEVVRILAHSDCSIVITRRSGRRPHLAEQIVGEIPDLAAGLGAVGRRSAALPHLRYVIDLDDEELPLVCTGTARAAALDVPDELVDAAASSVHPSDPATMIYTSGSTSDPKGVVHSHRAVIAQTNQLAQDMSFEPTTRNYTTMPFFWVGGLAMSLLPTLAVGGLHATTERVDPDQIFDVIEREQLDRVFVYPARNLTTVLRHPRYETADLNSVRRGTPGIPREYDVTKGISYTTDGLSMGLGMSETFGPYWWGRPTSPPDDYTPPLERTNDDFDIKVVKDDGTPAGEGERGEIRVRGPHVTIGLQKVERSSVFDDDGYYRTGDIGLVVDGGIRFRGRAGDIIKVDGANVAAAEVVAALLASPGVAEAHVAPLRTDSGQQIGAAVVADEGVSLDVDRLRTDLARRLARYKVPAVLRVLRYDQIPLTATGKLNQRVFARVLLDGQGTTPTDRSNDQEVLA